MGAMVESIRVMMPSEIMVIKTSIHRNMVWRTPEFTCEQLLSLSCRTSHFEEVHKSGTLKN